MCKFLSAIVKPNGDVICRPDATDAHSDLIEFAGIDDRTTESVCCVEFTSNTPFDPDTYVLRVDQSRRPTWFSEDMEQRTAEDLLARINRMVIREDKKILLGGAWLIPPDVTVERAVRSRVVLCAGRLTVAVNSQVGKMWGSSQAPRKPTLTRKLVAP